MLDIGVCLPQLPDFSLVLVVGALIRLNRLKFCFSFFIFFSLPRSHL